MSYQITEISQQSHPEIGVRVTEISEDIIVGKDKSSSGGFSQWLKESQRLCKENNYYFSHNAFMQLRTYYKANLTPVQAVKKYFL